MPFNGIRTHTPCIPSGLTALACAVCGVQPPSDKSRPLPCRIGAITHNSELVQGLGITTKTYSDTDSPAHCTSSWHLLDSSVVIAALGPVCKPS